MLWQAPRNKRTRNGNLDDPVLPEGEEWQVAFLVARATGKDGKKYLVRWDGYGAAADTWQSEADLAGAKETVKAFNERKDQEEKVEQEASKAKHAELVKQKREQAQVIVLCLCLPTGCAHACFGLCPRRRFHTRAVTLLVSVQGTPQDDASKHGC